MVQNVNNQNNNYGSIARVGTTQEGRAIYELVQPNGQIAGKMTIPQADCDRFEKAYQDIVSGAPKMEAYMKKHSSPEATKKRKKLSNWLIFGTAGLGALIPAIFVKGGKHPGLKQVSLTLCGLIAGFAGGIGLNYAFLMPPGMRNMSKASKELSKIDIQPYA